MLISCSYCRQDKPRDQYRIHKGKRSGQLIQPCIPCAKEYGRNYRARNNDKMRSYALKSLLKIRYGLAVEDYNNILAEQNGKCAICRADSPGNKRLRRFVVDHDHYTGKVRGLLCENCNRALGMMADNSERFHAAARYLERYQRKAAA